MITDFYIPPHPALLPWVSHYVLSTSRGCREVFGNHWAASHETSILFFLADTPTHTTSSREADLSGLDHCVVGLQTRPNGFVHFRGCYHTFIIHFTTNGFTRLFGLPAQALLDRVVDTSTVAGQSAGRLHDQLTEAKSSEQMVRCADQFLLGFLAKSKPVLYPPDGVTHIARAITAGVPVWRVDQCARQASMSVRNFTRRFAQQTGVSPKFYLKLVRVNQVLTNKLLMPRKSWTAIACDYGYFDQAHLVNDFRQLVGLTPTQYMDQQAQFTTQLTVVDQADFGEQGRC